MKKLLVLSIVGFAAANMKAPVFVNKALALQEVDSTTTTDDSSVVVAPATTQEETTTDVPAEDTTTTSDEGAVADETTTSDETVTDDTTTTTDDTTTATDDTTTATDDTTTTTDDQTYGDDTTGTTEEPEDDTEIVVRINKNKVRNFIRDTRNYVNSDAVQHIVDSKQQVIKETANLYKNTAAKIALNFGKKVAPVLESFGEATDIYQVEDECDQTCATNCFNAEALLSGGFNVFDSDCLADCNCHFKADKLSDKKTEKALKKFQKFFEKADKLKEFVEDAHNNQDKSALEWAVSEYEFQVAIHQSEFADYVRNQANTVLKCEEGCVDTCTSQAWIEFADIPNCLQWCSCEQGVFDITEESASYNYPALVDYAEGDQQAWSFFQMIKNKL